MKGPDKNENLPGLLEGLAEPLRSIAGILREGVDQVMKDVKKDIHSSEVHKALGEFKKAWEAMRKDLRKTVLGILLAVTGESELKFPKNQHRDAAAEHRPLDED